jgi:hypothetical protein
VHIIKGFNVPIRNSAKQDILSHFQGGGGGGGGYQQRNNTNMMNATRQMDPYNRTAGPPGPYPSTFGQLQNTNMLAASAFIGAGAGNQYDPRASFMGGGNFN